MATSGLHRELCERAGKWLRGTAGCQVVAVETVSAEREQPDAIGFQATQSFVVEVKVSRADFLADAKKLHRKPGRGMGTYRWFLTPPGLLSFEEIPAGWGLLEAHATCIRIVKGRLSSSRPMPHWDDTLKTTVEPPMPKAGYAKQNNPDIAAERRLLFRIARDAIGSNNCPSQVHQPSEQGDTDV